MKTTQFHLTLLPSFFLLFLFDFSFARSAQAQGEPSASHRHSRPARTRHSAEERSIAYSQAATDSTYTTQSSGRIAAGFSTISSTIPGATAALTAIYDLSHVDSLQGFFSIPYTSPFNIGGAVFYKRTIAESSGAGFHVGGGIGLGNVNGQGIAGPAFAMMLSAIGGFHFELPGISHINFHLDGGPTFILVSTSPTATTNFQVGALSPGLGASIVYVF